ncbi:MAG TPA: sigma-54 dependent transcriptional regulator [Vicinamibacterales bacterium]|jgi:DNA-binding NtrC family response regulator|nr:sigma-54 dependent transcriptional regulator [Vicinamibacterales bacterium]
MGPSTLGRVLIADDQVNILDALKLLLGGEGYDVTTAASPPELVSALERSDFDVALIDLNYTRDTTSGQEGFELLDRMRAIDPTLPVLVMTGWSSIAGAVEAMRRGARDYIEKPWDDDKLIAAVQTQLELRRALRRSRRLQEENTRLQRRDLPTFIAEAPAMRQVRETIERVAPSDASVLITGEHGTGKEVVASLLHRLSTRASKPLVTMNAGGLSEGVAESELFGHVKGAFTDARTDRIGCFELADEGTLFLDEIANMPAKLQPKLLRVLQTGEVQRVGSSRVTYVNVRVLSATNADLPAEISSGRFREDLFYRLNTVVIQLPPLRDRREDIWPLAEHYLARYSDRYRRHFDGFDRSARQAMEAHLWPGNVRELGHAIERAVLMASSSEITAVDLGLQATTASGGGPDEMTLEQAEKIFIQKVLARHGGDVRKAAEQLGMSRSALYRRLQQFGL